MDLEPTWQLFIKQLTLDECIYKAYWKKITGIPFLYIQITQDTPHSTLESLIKKCSDIAIKGKRLHSETVFVRQDDMLFVYRHRFYVPQEKMFCCGNLCVDCTRLKG
jgi:hypothetical protein